MTDMQIIQNFLEGVQESGKTTTAYDTTAEVIRVDENSVWVHIPGGVAETPVARTINAKKGDVVQVRVSGGTAFIVGNATAPPTDDATAIVAQGTADEAKETADVAKEVADAAAAQVQTVRNYFWHDAAGAHVSTVEGDATTGKNVLIDSNGLHVRNGTTTLAEFLSELIKLGAESNNAVIQFCNGKIEFAYHDGYIALQPGGAYDPDPGMTYGADIALWSRFASASGYRAGMSFGDGIITAYGSLRVPIWGLGGPIGFLPIMANDGTFYDVAKRVFMAVSLTESQQYAKTATIAHWLTGNDAMFIQIFDETGVEPEEPDIEPRDIDYDLRVGDVVLVQFTGGNTAAAPRLEVNGTGDYPIRALIGSAWQKRFNWNKACILPFVFTGEYWLLLNSSENSDLPPTWTAPTYNSSRGTTTYGGYYKVGRTVYVQLVCVWNGNVSGGGTSDTGNNVGFITNFPQALNYAALSCINRTKGNSLVGCWAENSGNSVRLCWSSGGLATGDTLYIAGTYFATS